MPGPKPTNLAGRTYGRLSVISLSGTNGNGARWLCRCECGKELVLPAINLTRTKKATRSCGCLQPERVGAVARTHGRTLTPEYAVWRQMIARCTKPNHAVYPRYGARGITVCDQWLTFEGFIADMGDRPSDSHTLERKDNDGPYSPENCVWETRTRQQRNKSDTRFLTLNGVTKSIADWADDIGVKAHTLRSRIRYGWPVERILTTQTIKKSH